jgi:hypothetical protein
MAVCWPRRYFSLCDEIADFLRGSSRRGEKPSFFAHICLEFHFLHAPCFLKPISVEGEPLHIFKVARWLYIVLFHNIYILYLLLYYDKRR